MKLFPNPFVQDFYIGFYNKTEELPVFFEIIIYDLFGKIITTKSYKEINHEYNIFNIPELNSLNTGIYIVQVSANENIYTQYIVKN